MHAMRILYEQVFQQQINYNMHKTIYNQGSGLAFALAQQPKVCLIKTIYYHLYSQLQYNYIWKAMLHFCLFWGPDWHVKPMSPRYVRSGNLSYRRRQPELWVALSMPTRCLRAGQCRGWQPCFPGPDCSNWGKSRSLQDWDHTFDSGTTVVESVRNDTRHENIL